MFGNAGEAETNARIRSKSDVDAGAIERHQVLLVHRQRFSRPLRSRSIMNLLLPRGIFQLRFYGGVQRPVHEWIGSDLRLVRKDEVRIVERQGRNVPGSSLL